MFRKKMLKDILHTLLVIENELLTIRKYLKSAGYKNDDGRIILSIDEGVQGSNREYWSTDVLKREINAYLNTGDVESVTIKMKVGRNDTGNIDGTYASIHIGTEEDEE